MNITEVEKTAECIKRDGPFLSVRVSDDRQRIIAIRQSVDGFEIVAGLDFSEHEEIYVYDSMTGAALAFVEWSGNPGTSPKRWILHWLLPTGRRPSNLEEVHA